MTELEVKHFLDGLDHLDTINLEEKLADSPNVNLFDDNIFIDLSKCQFAELGALTQLVLIIESLLKSRHIIYIALPTIKLTTNQTKSIKNPQWSILSLNKQISTTNFIKKTGFVNILQEISKEYKSEIYFTEEYDYVKKGKKINIDSFTDVFSTIYDEILINEANYKFLLPFKLIDCEKGIDQIKDFENNLDKVLQNQERGLESFDVKVIKNVILSELIKNVKIHSDSKFAVFAVGLINTKSIISDRNHKKFNPIEENYINYIETNNIDSQVEIYFGDSGIGVLNERYKTSVVKDFGVKPTDLKELLRLSFNKWSSIQDNEPRRGTKGLYRLKRIVDKYKGIVHIKTSDSNGGFFKGFFEYRKTKKKFEGTLISVKLSPFKEIKAFKISNEKKISNDQWISEKVKLDNELNCLNVIRKKVLKGDNLLLITDISNLNLSLDSKLIERFFYEISFICHPSAIVLYLINQKQEIDNDTVELLVESVQTRISKSNNESVSPENESPDFEEVHDPVLLIGKNNQTFWYGGSNKLIKIIDESYSTISSSKNTAINNLSNFQKLEIDEQIEIINYLKTDNNLITLNNNGEIEFNFYGIESHYESKIINFKPKIENKSICTPKLNIINNWIDIIDLLKDDEYGFALCLYLKFRKKYESEKGEITQFDKKNTFILIDHTQQLELTKKFSELLGLKYKNIRNIEEEIDFSMPKRTKLFNDHSNVIFLTTIVSSSETIRRMVKFAKRDNAVPDVILCLMNYRKNKIDKLETWNETTEIISIYQKYNVETNSLIRDDNYFKLKLEELSTFDVCINPNFVIDTNEIGTAIVVKDNLLSYLNKNKFLHYNHYGHNNKRHFTFYLDKIGIINSVDELFANSLKETIQKWLGSKNIKKYTLYINKSIINNAFHFHGFLEKNFKGFYKFIDVKKNFLIDKNSIYFDFGILTGESINNIINQVDNTNNLLICLLFNQSINSYANIYKKIGTLKFDSETNLLPIGSNNNTKFVDFQIEYLYDLPLSFFNSETCPICEHRRALDYYKQEELYFESFSNDRRERLKQNPIEEIYELPTPVDFYYSEKEEERNQELSREIIFHMYEFKLLLENATIFTRQRIELFELLYKLYINLEDELKNSESKIYAVLYYLSHEINWLQKEPLVFRDFRILLSKISHKIATINLDLLIENFDINNLYNIPSKHLATRYKYSAISVLRSTDKLLFCQNIGDIIRSSFYQNNCSNNLLQNTIYHISSFFKNNYNKSELYFIEIESNLNLIIKDYSGLQNLQINAVNFIREKNREFLLNFRNLGDEQKAFKEMKEKWEELYFTEMPKHPEPYQEFKSLLSLEQHLETLDAIKANPTLTDEMNLLKTLVRQLPLRFSNVNNYIYNNILFYFSDKLNYLIKSKYFKDEFKNSLSVTDVKNKVGQMNDIIELIDIDLFEYKNKREEFNLIYSYLSENLFAKKYLDGTNKNSKLIELLNDFPLSINPIIMEVFPHQQFPNQKILFFYKDISIPNSNKNVYFPKSIFKRHLENIKNNLMQKLNKNTRLEDTKIAFELSISEDEFLYFNITYNNTNEWHSSPNPNGSLNTLKKHIEDFKGEFSYSVSDSNNENFTLNFKFLRYD